VIESGLAVLASDIRGDASFKGASSVHRFRIRSVLAVPLGPRPVRGVLYLDTQAAERAFSAEDLDFATALAVQAALVLDRVEEHARTAEALARSDERVELLEAELLRHEIVGRSPALLQAYDALRRFARAGARVLLRGETGTGKELSSTGSDPCWTRDASVSPWTSSIEIQRSAPSCPPSCSRQTLGWLTCRASLTSERNRRSASGPRADCARWTLSATSSSSTRSKAR
jgi:hypothetical protein